MIKLKVKDYIQEGNINVSRIDLDTRTASELEYQASLRVLLYDYLENYEDANINSVLKQLKEDFINRRAKNC